MNKKPQVPRMKARKRRLLIYLGLAATFVCLYLLRGHYLAAACSTEMHQITSPDGANYVTVSETVCDSFGGGDVVTVSVHTSSGGSPIFVFDPSSFSSPIDVRWVNATTIDVSIERVQIVQKKINDANGVSVRYHIGAVGEPVERLMPKQPPRKD